MQLVPQVVATTKLATSAPTPLVKRTSLLGWQLEEESVEMEKWLNLEKTDPT